MWREALHSDLKYHCSFGQQEFVNVGPESAVVAAGASVEPEWLESEKVRANPAMLGALRDGTVRR